MYLQIQKKERKKMEEKTKKNPNMHTDIRKQKKKQINRKKEKK